MSNNRGYFDNNWYKAYSKRSTENVIYAMFLERIIKESKDPVAIRLAATALEAAGCCKSDEPRAMRLVYGDRIKEG